MDDFRKLLRDAMKSRAMVYEAAFDEMRKEIGDGKAREIMARTIYRRGAAIAHNFAPHAPADLAGLRDAFLKFIPDAEAQFGPEVVRCTDEVLEIRFHTCPLKEAWMEAKLPVETVETLCELAGSVDKGTFETAGFDIEVDTWKPGRSTCCHLTITPGRPAPAAAL
ncbi:L-2-amino-thiazoline-4-carboxylic acid hydrolase [Azospirillum lipoferum]|uniref:L-2-amino-thiazoline-4-carboxylic acid hydrolase n=1 Tax=Azospirillum lipoferum (strain 4B) TaxID=862719 RepID=G7ZGF2_AZOL4|nr:L-2-amino-thiazoline-4-carboxylic acid hydrolase [Azospirillum lipoferum]CBS90956.1 conserved protein of unknown function [Azospirillum lipoferum 4B]